MSKVLSTLAWLAALTSAAVLAALLLYMRGSDSNHSGFEPWLLSFVFAPAAIIGTVALKLSRSRWGALLALLLGLGGMAFLFYIDHFNILLQYERWTERGMP